MSKIPKKILLPVLSLALFGLTAAEPEISVTPTSPNHTEIVIRDTSPEAFQRNRERAERARERLERKRQRRQEVELVRNDRRYNRTPVTSAGQIRRNPYLRSIEERQRAHAARNQPPAFFNGGQWSGGFAGPAWGGFGFGFGPGFVQPGFGFPPVGFGPACGPGFRGRGFRNRGFVNRGFRRGGFRGGFVRRGGFCR